MKKKSNNDKSSLLSLVITVIVIIFITIIWALNQYYKWFNFTISDLILAITAVIIFSYTFETFKIREANEKIAKANYELLSQQRQPVVSFVFDEKSQKIANFSFHLINLSGSAVSVLVNLTIEIEGKIFEHHWPEYKGERYWNLQYQEEKTGGFDVIVLLDQIGINKGDIIKENFIFDPRDQRIRDLENLFKKQGISFPTSLIFKIEIFSQNATGDFVYYPSSVYNYDLSQLKLKPQVTSDKPYWEYGKKPDWVN